MCDNKRLWKLAEIEEYVVANRLVNYDYIMSHVSNLPFIEEARTDKRCGFVFDKNGTGDVLLIIKSNPWNVNEKTGSSNIGFFVSSYNKGRDITAWVAYQDEYGIRDNGEVGEYTADEIENLDGFIKALENDVDICPNCGKKVGRENMKRFYFAGRCCEECLPAMKRQYEIAGWYN